MNTPQMHNSQEDSTQIFLSIRRKHLGLIISSTNTPQMHNSEEDSTQIFLLIRRKHLDLIARSTDTR